VEIGRFGVRVAQLRQADPGESGDAARELEELGYGAVWMSAMGPEGLEEAVRAPLAATGSIVVATSIVSIWTHPAGPTAELYRRIDDEFPGRFLLGLGVSHELLVERAGHDYTRPYSAMRSYLEELDAGGVPPSGRVLAALAPKMLELSRDRAAGSHPFMSPPAHTAWARTVLGEGPLLAPDLKLLLETDPGRARELGRKAIAFHISLPNYVANLVRSGFEEADVQDGGSDRLVDAVVAWGGPEQILGRAQEHLDAGADHVVLEPAYGADAPLPREAWQALAPGR
jgi:probable F420-dependent oxidoreductase